MKQIDVTVKYFVKYKIKAKCHEHKANGII